MVKFGIYQYFLKIQPTELIYELDVVCEKKSRITQILTFCREEGGLVLLYECGGVGRDQE